MSSNKMSAGSHIMLSDSYVYLSISILKHPHITRVLIPCVEMTYHSTMRSAFSGQVFIEDALQLAHQGDMLGVFCDFTILLLFYLGTCEIASCVALLYRD